MESELQDDPKATPDTGGASTLEARLERYLSQGTQADTKPEPKEPKQRAESEDDDKPEPKEPTEKKAATAKKDVEPDDDGGDEKDERTQLSTTDLAKFLGVDESVLDVDDDGTVKFKTKVDGKDGAAKLSDFLKSYQLEGHVNKKSMELAEREKAAEARAKEAEAQVSQRLQYVEALANYAGRQLMAEFQSIDWRTLESQDPGQAALMRQKFQDRQNELRQVFTGLVQEKTNSEQKTLAERQEILRREWQRLPDLIPEWRDEKVLAKEHAELREWAIKTAGYEPAEIDNITKAHHVAALRKAMLADKLSSQKTEIENKVRKAPVLVKPGQPQESTKEQKLQGLKKAVQNSGGKYGNLERFLIASGKV